MNVEDSSMFQFLFFLYRKIPSLLEYFGYLFHYSTILVGPVCTFKEFNDFIDGSDIRPVVSHVAFTSCILVRLTGTLYMANISVCICGGDRGWVGAQE